MTELKGRTTLSRYLMIGLTSFVCWGVAHAQSRDTLPSWHDGAAKSAIVGFVEAVTTEGGGDFVAPEEPRNGLLGACASMGLVVGAATAGPAPLCDGYSGLPEGDGPTAGMVWVEGGSFIMGSEGHHPEERAAHAVTVEGFWIDVHEVTNAEFAGFVEATGYRTLAERGLDPKDHPGMPPELLVPGSMVFFVPEQIANMADLSQWWRYVPGADWRHPQGPGSSIEGEDNHPVVHVAYEDALAYADWAGRRLPTEAEWERAARGGLDGAAYTWGDSYDPVEGWKANSWQGNFPQRDEVLDGHRGTAPVGCFAPNGYGLLDMAGNVWEWTADWYVPGFAPAPVTDPAGPGMVQAAAAAPDGLPRRVIKGGSWLCAPNFCARYRPAARQPMDADLGASHIGFRTISDAPPPDG